MSIYACAKIEKHRSENLVIFQLSRSPREIHACFIPTRDHSIGRHLDLNQSQVRLPRLIVPVFIEFTGSDTLVGGAQMRYLSARPHMSDFRSNFISVSFVIFVFMVRFIKAIHPSRRIIRLTDVPSQCKHESKYPDGARMALSILARAMKQSSQFCIVCCEIPLTTRNERLFPRKEFVYIILYLNYNIWMYHRAGRTRQYVYLYTLRR